MLLLIVCLYMHLSALNPSRLLCKIWYLSLYGDIRDVIVLIKFLYIVFASATGLWFDNRDGSLFCIIVLLSLFFKRLILVLHLLSPITFVFI